MIRVTWIVIHYLKLRLLFHEKPHLQKAEQATLHFLPIFQNVLTAMTRLVEGDLTGVEKVGIAFFANGDTF